MVWLNNKTMKKLLTLLILIALFIPNTAFGAFAVGWNATSTAQGWIWPNLVNGISQKVAAFNFIASFFTSTSTTASTFPYASTTAISGTNAYFTKLGNLTSNGFVKTSGSDGTLSVDTTTYESGLTAGDGLTRTSNDFDCDIASGSVFGCLSSADWTTFNNKQAAGNYVTDLTGDVTASGPGSAAATLATVNSNVGSFTNANITVNAKGLITAASNGTGGSGTIDGTGFAGMIASWLDGDTIQATSTIVGSHLVATSTTATSTFAGALQLGTRMNMNGAKLFDQSYNKYQSSGITNEQISWHNITRPATFNPSRERLATFKNIVQTNNSITGGVGISGATFVPGVDLLFMVDNNSVNVSIYNAAQVDGTEFGNITFSGFSDPEGLTLLWVTNDANGVPDKAVFAVSEEQINQITLFEWDLQATSGTITKSDWPTIDATNMFAESATLGMEALTYIPDINSIFTCNQAATECRIIPLDGSLTPAATEPFDAATVWSGAGIPNLNDLTWDQSTKMVIAIGDETGVSNANQDIWMFDPYSGTIIEYWNNYVTDLGLTTAAGWVQSEGIAISPDGQNLWVTSEGNEIAWLRRSNVEQSSYFSGNVGIGTSSPYAKLSVVGETVARNFTATTTATSTLPRLETAGLNNTGFFTFDGITGSTWASFCTSITGSASLCDGNDATGGGGGGIGTVSTSTNETSGYVPYWTSTSGTPATLGSDSGMQYSAASDRLTVTNASTTALSVLNTLYSALSNDLSTSFDALCFGSDPGVGFYGFPFCLRWDKTNNRMFFNDGNGAPLSIQANTLYSTGISNSGSIDNLTGRITTLNASSTNLSTTYASSTRYFGADLVDCDNTTNSKLLWSDTGRFLCGTDQSGSGGTGNVATSTGETAGNLAYWTSTNGTPATLGKISTTSVTCTGSATCDPFTVIGASPITINASAGSGVGLATSTPMVDTYVVYGTGASTVGAEAAFTYDDATNILSVGTASSSQFIAGQASAASPSYTFTGAGNYGLYYNADNSIRMSGAGNDVMRWTNSGTFALSPISGTNSKTFRLNPDAGAVGTPTYAFDNDANTGIWSQYADALNLAVGGAELFRGDIASTTWFSTRNTFTNASTTNATVSSNLWITPLTSALIQTNAAGLTSEYAGTTCNDSVITSLTALGVGDCVKVDLNLGAMVTGSLPLANMAASTISGISLGSNLADLTATNGTLTFSGTYNGSTARTIGLNLANANSWTARQNFLNASSTLLSSGVSYFGATATTTISGDGSITMPSGSTFTKTGTTDGCATWASGVLGTTGTACGSGGGGGSSGGTWSTTTSTVSGRLVNYSNNNSDIVAIGSNSTTTAEFFFDPNVVTANIGNSVPPQLSAFGTGYHPFMIASTSNDVIGMNIFNRSAGSQAGTGIFFAGANTPITGAGAAATYYGGLVHVGPNFNGVPLGFGAATPNSLSLYNTDGRLILGSATTTGEIDGYVGMGSFAGGVPDFTVISNGNFGIATSSPYARLSVVGETVARNFTATSTTATTTLQGGLNVGQGDLVTDFTTGVTTINGSIQGNFSFDDDAGFVTAMDLPVVSAANDTTQGYTFNIDATTTPPFTIYGVSGGSGGLKRYGVGVATTSPWRTLGVTGTVAISGLTTSSGTPNSVCINSTTKEITENAALTCTVSDEEQKSPLKALDFSALDMISEIKPSSFSYNDQPDRLRYGFGAQSLQAVDPRLADGYDKDGIARSIDLPALTAINTKAIQELAAREDTAGTGGSTQDKIQWIVIILLAGWCTILTIKRK